MGCTGSIYDGIPVTGHKTGFSVIPVPDRRYIKPETTVMKLHEHFRSFHGDDFSIKVGNYHCY